jgi:hypothetical protein
MMRSSKVRNAGTGRIRAEDFEGHRRFFFQKDEEIEA